MSDTVTVENIELAAKSLISEVNALVVARANVSIQRAVVEPIQREILDDYEYRGEDDTGADFHVTKDADSYMMHDKDATRYYAALNAAYVAQGYELPDVGYCPLLIAEHEVTKMQWALVDAAEKFMPNISHDGLIGAGMKAYNDYIALLVEMVQGERGYRNPAPKTERITS